MASKHCKKNLKNIPQIIPGSIRYSHKLFVGAEIVNCFAVISYWHWSALVVNDKIGVDVVDTGEGVVNDNIGVDVVDTGEGVDLVVVIEAVDIDTGEGVDDNDDMVEGADDTEDMEEGADVDLVEEPIVGLDVVDKGDHASPSQLQQGLE